MALATLKPGDPIHSATTLGPPSTKAALVKLLEQIQQAVTHGDKRVTSQTGTGLVFINHPAWTAPDLPFGGIKDFGYGRELSSMGIQKFVNKKLVRVADIDAPAQFSWMASVALCN